ncbi:uncharacterized protein CDV56_103499 [Aspergillus thermomutatus]|uniref:Uncharacterized protein n=1 Tax=Aspergillus thermomutatus TaxID=41047 RepID=A0A397G052_ASPTH|nr:uncharacterized protein CDV56_103499 [Aspergillus thermomutatus]RHZ44422.1 hypothetical protein CDV56_103499 [Aspergillus thermomutatus]
MSLTHLSDNALNIALRAAARAVIQSLQAMPELQGAKVAIVGGLAVQNYVKIKRRTLDVDVLLFRPDHPIDTQWIRKELVSRFRKSFKACGQPLFFKYKCKGKRKGKRKGTRKGKLKAKPKCKRTYLVQVDIIPGYLPPYLPGNAMTLEDVNLKHLPFIALLDLLAYKVHSSSMRSCPKKQKQDAKDATRLWKTLYGQRYVPLSDGQ